MLKGPHAHTQRLYIITLKFMANMIIPPTKVNKPQAQVPFHVHHQAQPTHKIHEMRLGDYTLTLLWSPLNHLCCLGPFKSKTIYWLMVPVDH